MQHNGTHTNGQNGFIKLHCPTCHSTLLTTNTINRICRHCLKRWRLHVDLFPIVTDDDLEMWTDLLLQNLEVGPNNRRDWRKKESTDD